MIGRHQNPWAELNIKKAEQDGVMIARRNSGGGTVSGRSLVVSGRSLVVSGWSLVVSGWSLVFSGWSLVVSGWSLTKRRQSKMV